MSSHYCCNLRIYSLLLCLAVFSGCAEQDAGFASDIKPGEMLPVLQVKTLGGELTQFIPNSGKITILNIWASWCAPCRRELPSLQRLSEKLDADSFQVIGVSIDDDLHLVREYLLDRGVSYENFLDQSAIEVRRHLGPKMFPVTYLVSEEGVLLKEVLGERAWDDREMVVLLEKAKGTPGILLRDDALKAIGLSELRKSGAVMAP